MFTETTCPFMLVCCKNSLAAADVTLLDGPPRVPDMNSIGSVCSRVKKLCRRIVFPSSERWWCSPWTLGSVAWGAVVSSDQYVSFGVGSLQRRELQLRL